MIVLILITDCHCVNRYRVFYLILSANLSNDSFHPDFVNSLIYPSLIAWNSVMSAEHIHYCLLLIKAAASKAPTTAPTPAAINTAFSGFFFI